MSVSINAKGYAWKEGEFSDAFLMPDNLLIVPTRPGALRYDPATLAVEKYDGPVLGWNPIAAPVLDPDLVTIAGLAPVNGSILFRDAGVWSTKTISEYKTQLELDLVENTALSTWPGSTNITTLGTIVAGIWNGTPIPINRAGVPPGGSAGQVLKKVSGTDYDYAWGADNTGGGGGPVADGTYGDITVSSTGTVWTVGNSAINSVKIADLAVTTAKIANDAITFAKFQNIAQAKLLGRYTASTGDMQEITLGAGLTLNATTGELTAGDMKTNAVNSMTTSSSIIFPSGNYTPLRVGALEMFSSSAAISSIGHNVYYDGAYKYRSTGKAYMIEFDTSTDAIYFYMHPSAAAGSTFPPDTIPFIFHRTTGIGIIGTGMYLNFGTGTGVNGYGFRDDGGVMKYKDSGGSWIAFDSLGGGGGSTSTGEGVTVTGGSAFIGNTSATSTGQFTADRFVGLNGNTLNFFGNNGSDPMMSFTRTSGTTFDFLRFIPDDGNALPIGMGWFKSVGANTSGDPDNRIFNIGINVNGAGNRIGASGTPQNFLSFEQNFQATVFASSQQVETHLIQVGLRSWSFNVQHDGTYAYGYFTADRLYAQDHSGNMFVDWVKNDMRLYRNGTTNPVIQFGSSATDMTLPNNATPEVILRHSLHDVLSATISSTRASRIIVVGSNTAQLASNASTFYLNKGNGATFGGFIGNEDNAVPTYVHSLHSYTMRFSRINPDGTIYDTDTKTFRLVTDGTGAGYANYLTSRALDIEINGTTYKVPIIATGDLNPTPGNSKYYGTNSSGVFGFYAVGSGGAGTLDDTLAAGSTLTAARSIDAGGFALTFVNSTNDDQIRLGQDTTTFYKIGRNGTDGYLKFTGNQAAPYTGYTFNGPADFSGAITSGGNPVLINWASNVGLGGGTGATTAMLQVIGDIKISADQSSTADYRIFRSGSTGFLNFDGNQTGFIGYTFDGPTMIGATSQAGTEMLRVVGNSILDGHVTVGSISADPTGANGMFFYNSTSNKFRAYQNGAWVDMIGGGSTTDASLLTTGYLPVGRINGTPNDGDVATAIGGVIVWHTPASSANVDGGSYSATGTAIANATSVSPNSHQFVRSDDGVTVSGMCNFTVTTGGVLTEIRISLPVASNLATQDQLLGVAIISTGGSEIFRVAADVTNNEALISYTPSTSGGKIVCYHFTYQII